MDILSYVIGKSAGEAAAHVDIEQLDVTENGTYIASEGCAYNPVVVDVRDTSLPENDVTFYDYDGTVLYSYDKQEFLALDSLPENPKHDKLISSGWSCDLTTAKTRLLESGKCYIGQLYEIENDATHIFVNLYGVSQLHARLNLVVTGTIVVDWGDGSVVDTSTTTSSTSVFISHKYDKPGKYRIIVTPDSNSSFSFPAGSTGTSLENGASFLTSDDGNTYMQPLYRLSIYGLMLGKVSINNQYSLSNLANLSFLLLSTKVSFTSGGEYSIYSELSLETVIIPSITLNINALFLICNALRVVILGNGARIGTSNILSSNQSLQYIEMYDVPSFPATVFSSCYTLESIVFPASVTSIAASFSYLYSLKKLKFVRKTPATISNKNAFYGLPTTCIIYVPSSDLASYLTATNYPSSNTYTYIGFATYEGTVNLPVRDPTDAYSLTWYASEEDALAQTNPIMVGNGNEIYCRYVAI